MQVNRLACGQLNTQNPNKQSFGKLIMPSESELEALDGQFYLISKPLINGQDRINEALKVSISPNEPPIDEYRLHLIPERGLTIQEDKLHLVLKWVPFPDTQNPLKRFLNKTLSWSKLHERFTKTHSIDTNKYQKYPNGNNLLAKTEDVLSAKAKYVLFRDNDILDAVIQKTTYLKGIMDKNKDAKICKRFINLCIKLDKNVEKRLPKKYIPGWWY